MDYFKAINGKTFDQWKKKNRIPKIDESIKKIVTQSHSEYDLRVLGSGDSGELLISEEQREAGFHIIGQPRQGKSKFIEDNIRKDIDMGNGLCLLDPSDNGDTCKKVLRYCALKGIKNVVYIDPATLVEYGKIATLQPLKSNYVTKSVDSVMETVKYVFGSSAQTDTPRIARYFEALLTVLAKRNLTLHETKYFRLFQPASELPFLGIDEDSMILKEAFRTENTFVNYFLSTVGRLNTFRKEPISLMLGADTGIDFVKMIRDGWVVLVNLYPGKYLTVTQARLLGIMVMAEVIHAIDVLFSNNWKGVHYLYLDEAARFASPQIKDLLDYKGKTGLRLIIAHHDFSQFKDKDVLTAIKNGCRVKMMFNISSYKDRLEMVEDLGYGGDIPPVLAAYVNQNIPKRQMIIKNDKDTPVRIEVPNVPDITEAELPKERLQEYVRSLLEQPWYLTKEEINEQINRRFNAPIIRKNTKSSKSRKVDDPQTDRPSAVSRTVSGKLAEGIRPDHQKSSEPPPKRPIKI